VRKAIAVQPGADRSHAYLAAWEAIQGDTAGSLRVAGQATKPYWKDWALAMAYEARHDTTRADTALHALIAGYAGLAAYQIAEVYADLDRPDQAFTWLERALHQHDPGIHELLFDPFLLRYRHDPRFAAFCRKAGLPLRRGTERP
jgi:adenylate cyclase